MTANMPAAAGTSVAPPGQPGGTAAVLDHAQVLAGATARNARNELRTRWSSGIRWPLLAVLAVQLALSLRLVWSSTAFQDEGLYLRAGHLEWARLLHGTS